MATAQMDTVIRQLRRAVLRQDGAGRTDGQLLGSFIDQKDEAAFEALVRRHAPMVFGVCRRVVGNHHDAEDAFQATFLVLARKASSVRPRERVANWLHGVALRTAMKAKTMTAKRRGREKQVAEMPEPEAAQQGQWRDLQPLLDQELNGLPENYRLPILLCDLEGKTIKDAAQQLGWPQGSLAGRLARGRKLLAKRLASRGVVLSAGSLAAVVSQNAASAGVPTSLMSSTVKAAVMIAAGQATVAGAVPAKVAALTEGVLKSMMLTKLSKAAVVGLVVLCLCGLGIGGFQASSAQETKTTITTTTTTVTTKATKHGIEELQGKWVCGAESMVIDGDKWSTSNGGNSGQLKLVAVTGDVLSVDLIVTKGREKGHTAASIFRREGNILHACNSCIPNVDFGPRPTEFKSVGNNLYMKWQRQEEAVPRQLEGTWSLLSYQGDGSEAIGKTEARTLTIKGGRLETKVNGKPYQVSIVTMIDTSEAPWRLDTQFTEGGEGSMSAIVKVEGDTLKWCQSYGKAARPKEFGTMRGDGLNYSIWKRVKGTEAAEEQEGESKDSVESKKAVKQMVTTFFENFSQGKPEGNVKLFLTGDVTVVGVSGNGPPIWQKKMSELIKTDWKDGPSTPHVIDTMDVELLDELSPGSTLAVARVKVHTAFVRGQWVFTFTSVGGWRIVGCVIDTKLP